MIGVAEIVVVLAPTTDLFCHSLIFMKFNESIGRITAGLQCHAAQSNAFCNAACWDERSVRSVFDII